MSGLRTQGPGLQAGVSIIEILVGLTLGLMLVMGVSSLLIGSRQTSRVERNLLAMQANGRIAIDILAREIRKAGYRSDQLRALDEVFPAVSALAVGPIDATFAASAVVTATVDDDVLVRFQGTGDTWGSDCLSSGTIAINAAVVQRLWLQNGSLRCAYTRPGGSGNVALLDGIEAMAITYGIDTGSDGYADAYQARSAVTDWSKVVSVNVELRVVSSEDNLTESAQPYLGFDGVAVTPGDKRLRRTYSSVVALRTLMP